MVASGFLGNRQLFGLGLQEALVSWLLSSSMPSRARLGELGGACVSKDRVMGSVGIVSFPFSYTMTREKDFWTFLMGLHHSPAFLFCFSSLLPSP